MSFPGNLVWHKRSPLDLKETVMANWLCHSLVLKYSFYVCFGLKHEDCCKQILYGICCYLTPAGNTSSHFQPLWLLAVREKTCHRICFSISVSAAYQNRSLGLISVLLLGNAFWEWSIRLRKIGRGYEVLTFQVSSDSQHLWEDKHHVKWSSCPKEYDCPHLLFYHRG